LLQIVAGLHPDIERMPPKAKAIHLLHRNSLLRAWIDQGVPWSHDATPLASAQGAASATPALRWIDVSATAKGFASIFDKDGFQAGVENFSLRDALRPIQASRSGQAVSREDDFRIGVRYERTEVGFIDVGIDQYRKYYDNSGGFYPFPQPIFSLDRELSLRNGRAWADFGLTLPDWRRSHSVTSISSGRAPIHSAMGSVQDTPGRNCRQLLSRKKSIPLPRHR